MKPLVRILLLLASISWLVFTASRCLDLIQTALPDGPAQTFGYFALSALDGGILLWLGLFLFGCHGYMQYAIAALMIVFDLLGTIIAMGSDLLLNAARRGTTAALDPSLTFGVIVVLIIVLSLNIASGILFHVFDPELMKSRRSRAANDRLDFAELDEYDRQIDELTPGLVSKTTANRVAALRQKRLTESESTSGQPVPNR